MRITQIAILATLLLGTLLLGGCGEVEPTVEPPIPTEPSQPEALYGYFTFGEESVPVNTYTTAEEGLFLLKISPLEDILSATTYAIIGLHSELLGKEIDVTTKYHNFDYMFVYEDPTRYFSPLRPLRSGTIMLNRNSSGMVRAKVDVVLCDGTPFRYEQMLVPNAN